MVRTRKNKTMEKINDTEGEEVQEVLDEVVINKNEGDERKNKKQKLMEPRKITIDFTASYTDNSNVIDEMTYKRRKREEEEEEEEEEENKKRKLNLDLPKCLDIISQYVNDIMNNQNFNQSSNGENTFANIREKLSELLNFCSEKEG